MSNHREELALAVKQLAFDHGYYDRSAYINPETGEVQMRFVSAAKGDLWINIRDQPPSLLEEFANVYEEVHAIAIGLIHSLTRLRPLKYSEIATADLSPELRRDLAEEYHYYKAAFWGLRVTVALGYLAYTGHWQTLPIFFGW